MSAFAALLIPPTAAGSTETSRSSAATNVPEGVRARLKTRPASELLSAGEAAAVIIAWGNARGVSQRERETAIFAEFDKRHLLGDLPEVLAILRRQVSL